MMLILGFSAAAEEPADAPAIAKPKVLLDNRVKQDANSLGTSDTEIVPLVPKNAPADLPAVESSPRLPGDIQVDAEGKPLSTAPGAPHIARFADYVLGAPLDSRPVNKLNPVIENYASPVANELVREASNEYIFVPGSGPSGTALFNGQPSSEAPVLHSGPWTFHPAVAVENFLNDNFFGSVTHPRDSWLRNESAAFALGYNPNKQIALNAFYTFTMHDYSTTVVRDYYDETAGLSLSLKHFGIEGLSFNLSEVYSEIGNTVISPLADEYDLSNLQFVTGTRYATNVLPMTLQYAAGPWSLEAGYEYDVTDYFSRNESNRDAQQQLAKLRAAYAVIETQLNVFTEYSFNHTRYPSNEVQDFDLQRMAAGAAGKVGELTYRVRAGCHIENELETNRTYAEPALSADVNYLFSPRVDVSAFANHELNVGVLTGKEITSAYGGVLNVHPMKRGTLFFNVVNQHTSRTHSIERLRNAEMGYKHTILHRFEPRLGVKYTEDSGGFLNLDKFVTGYAGLGVKIGPRMSTDLNYYHEDRKRGDNSKRVTDRLSLAYNYRISQLSKVNLGFDRAERRNSSIKGTITIDELRLGVNLSW